MICLFFYSKATICGVFEKDKALCFRGLYLVIRLGLEPKTPTLKVLCSTC